MRGGLRMGSTEKTKQQEIPLNETLKELLSDMKYGSITIIVQDGKIVQIDKTEKHRF